MCTSFIGSEPRRRPGMAALQASDIVSAAKMPLSLTIEVTNECNYACPHCPRNELNSDRDLGFMSLELFQKIASESAGRVARFKFIGLGEPSLHPHIDTMLLTLKDAGIRSVLYTNGTLFERFSHETICQLGLETIVVSVDGLDERQFHRLRVGGNYRQLRDMTGAFRRFRRSHRIKRPYVEIRHVIMPGETTPMLRKFRREWVPEFADTMKFNTLITPYRRMRPDGARRAPCRDISRELHPRFDGRVPLCGYNGQREWLGDLGQMPLREIWNSQRLSDVRKLHAMRDLSGLPECRACQFR